MNLNYLFVGSGKKSNMEANAKMYKFLGILAVAVYCLYYFSTIQSGHFIDIVNLVIHEAGHVVFFPFGSFIMICGGSLLQIIIPSLFVWYFYKTRQKYSAYLSMFWVSINFFSVGLYASDAQAMQLPLLSGDSSGHDWHNILLALHLLDATKFIAGLIYFFGFAIIFAALYLAYLQFSEN